ncbi:GNAT family N-acetyltransferase [Adhaeribacter rhizoryzae]|uniref:GNAT family N-acetyltransferase n=1 Tax=Adhaeribacter rhizoryzae TaxID=2607907 RepID=A0A5M6CZE4_9BACT|nr:GNAT family N-acetyltransferase [Adhaeribacter rhizoryzae]KAA5540581.1 GNAT family N-acetyltransferase [Adhaeribacter rhizoryzae]
MNIFVRAITVADSTAVASLTNQLGYQTTAAETADLLAEILKSKTDLALVAEINKEVVGWIHAFYAIRLESGRFVEIGGLVVDAPHRGKGIGKILVAAVTQWASQYQITHIKVRCNTKRFASHQFYRQAGFTEVKEQKIFEIKV